MSARPPPSRGPPTATTSRSGCLGARATCAFGRFRRLAGDPQLADPLTRRSGSTEPNRDANRANDGLAVELRPVGQLLLREVPALGAQRGCGPRCAPQRGQIHALPAPAHTLRVVAGRVALRL
jgi:hypothetical protein